MLPLSFLALIGTVAALPSIRSPSSSSGPPAGYKAAPPSSPKPNITQITSTPQGSFKSYETGGLKRLPANVTEESLSKRWDCSTEPILTWGDADDGGRGISITNDGDDWRGFYVFHNSCDYIPWKYIWIEAGATQFISFPPLFEGRIQRGEDEYMLDGQPHLLGSWLEFSWDASDIGWIDVSLIRGCDGAILTWDLNNGDKWKGFTQWILDGAPEGAYDQKANGKWVIAATEGEGAVINTIPRDWILEKVGDEFVYVDDSHAKPVISGWRFGSFWPEGRA